MLAGVWVDSASSAPGNASASQISSEANRGATHFGVSGPSIVGGHEYAEAVTDPEPPSGWVAPDGEENGDLCAWRNLSALSLPTGSFAVQPTWSNRVSGCALSG